MKVQINHHAITTYLEKHDYETIGVLLEESFRLRRDLEGQPVKYDYSPEILKMILTISDTLFSQNYDLHNTLTKELFKSLRNYVITKEVQTQLTAELDFLNKLAFFISKNADSLTADVLKIILQFLINLVISNKEACNTLFEMYSDTIFMFLNKKICIYETSALLYNISLYKSLDGLEASIYETIFSLYNTNDETEYLYFLIENFLTYDQFWVNYNQFHIKHRLLILEIIRHKQTQGNAVNISDNAIQTITTKFINSNPIIFQTKVNADSELMLYEVTSLLEVLSSLCSDEKYLSKLQKNKDLLINIGILLINIHRLGKESENCFTSKQKLSEVEGHNDALNEHPIFGFKIGLIRVIGNMCWKNTVMQDLVRKAELIPVLLDCCNIDVRNPFIMQWVIFAIRNLCENNLKNQEIIAGLHKEGTVSSSTLEEMGLTLHDGGDNSIKIVPLESLHR